MGLFLHCAIALIVRKTLHVINAASDFGIEIVQAFSYYNIRSVLGVGTRYSACGIAYEELCQDTSNFGRTLAYTKEAGLFQIGITICLIRNRAL